eukprot:TRINITY_DN10231_c0_g1_i1.p1 TRINITY_DN10231_c0_g1~~TRINITY_DN10231_c0_g1_i1.p1  ORF type:complete len:432 (-),score=29.60 TRINITY_DN10231_c0_g1_i1:82-1293(-)
MSGASSTPALMRLSVSIATAALFQSLQPVVAAVAYPSSNLGLAVAGEADDGKACRLSHEALGQADVDDESDMVDLQLLQLGTAKVVDDRGHLHELPDDFDQFQSVYERLHLWEQEIATPLPTDLALVFGVFCMAADVDVRAVIRKTWMNQPSVCGILAPPSADCIAHAGFVLGTGEGEPTDDTYGDIMTLDIYENMNEGKSYQYFYEAARKFPWATHFVKLDTDTYPFLHILLPRISNVSRVAQQNDCDVYLGMAMMDNEYNKENVWKRPPETCERPLHGNMLEYRIDGDFVWDAEQHKNTYRKCFGYMQGGLYVISARIALAATAKGEAWSSDKVGPEDGMSGYHLVDYARRTDTCLSTWDPLTWYPFFLSLTATSQKGWLHLFLKKDWRSIDANLTSLGFE